MKTEVIQLAHATGGDVEGCTEVATMLTKAGAALSQEYGWQVVLDGMLSAYYTLAMDRLGPAGLLEVLTDLAEETRRRRQ